VSLPPQETILVWIDQAGSIAERRFQSSSEGSLDTRNDTVLAAAPSTELEIRAAGEDEKAVG
jgi:hypothetical protein